MTALGKASQLFHVAPSAEGRDLVRRGDAVRLRRARGVAVGLAFSVADVAVETLLEVRVRPKILSHGRVTGAAHLMEGLLRDSRGRRQE